MNLSLWILKGTEVHGGTWFIGTLVTVVIGNLTEKKRVLHLWFSEG